MGICDGRVVIVTGAGRGIGREEALLFAAEGAKVVVNDLGKEGDGSGDSQPVAQQVVDDIKAAGGEAIVNTDDVSDWEGAQRMINAAIETYGKLDTLVNNAGILRDRMLVNMTEEEWDAVIKVHLKGTFAPSRWAAAYWRELAKAGNPIEAPRMVNTSSSSGIYANPGQTNYGAAKSGIATFTQIAAKELKNYGVLCNAIAPGARTRLTENLMGGRAEPKPDEFDRSHPANVAPLVVWLGSSACEVTGQVFNVAGGMVGVAESWGRGPSEDKKDRWDPSELTAVVPKLVEAQRPAGSIGG
ncbi:MAG TPA: SDR family oxidoreductase [Acidimicrobiales bacterium]|nr:SDR family oxidoreductase [Acidimicrobiales bacterium]